MTRPGLSRREWLAGSVALLTAGGSRRTEGTWQPLATVASIDAVTGPVSADRLGVTLMHQHVLVEFIGAAQVSPSRDDANAVFQAVLPHLQEVKRLGCRPLVGRTPAYLGRARWIRESERGIDDTGIKPAFLKIGVDQSPLSAVDAKLVRAAAHPPRDRACDCLADGEVQQLIVAHPREALARRRS